MATEAASIIKAYASTVAQASDELDSFTKSSLQAANAVDNFSDSAKKADSITESLNKALGSGEVALMVYRTAIKSVTDAMDDMHSAAGAQAIILSEVEMRIDRLSGALVRIPAGCLELLKNEAFDLRAEMEQNLLPVFAESQRALNDMQKEAVQAGAAYGSAATGVAAYVAKTVGFEIAKKVLVQALKNAVPPKAKIVVDIAAIGIPVAIKVIDQLKKKSKEATSVLENMGEAASVAVGKTVNVMAEVEKLMANRRASQLSEEQKAIAELDKLYESAMAEALNRRAEAQAEVDWLNKLARAGVVVTMGAAVEELKASQHVLAQLSRNYNEDRVNISRAANERIAKDRRDVLRQIEFDQMDAEEREFAQLEVTYKERAKLFRAGTVGRYELDKWYESQRESISDKYTEILDNEIKTLEDSMVKDRQIRDDFINNLKSEDEQFKISYENRLAEIDNFFKANIDLEEKYGQLARDKALEDYEKQKSDRDKRLADEEARKQSEIQRFTDALLTEEEMLKVSLERRSLEIMNSALLTEEQKQKLILHYEEETSKKRATITQNALEQKKQLNQAYASSVAGIFGDISGLMNQENKSQFEAAKALSIAQATINAYLAITRTLAQYPGIRGTILASAQGALAFAQVAKIQSTKFSGAYWNGGTIPAGKKGIVGEYGPEIIQGPVTVTSGADTAALLDYVNEKNNVAPVSETSSMNITFQSSDGAVLENIQRTVRTREAIPVMRELFQLAKDEGMLG